jgi:hypothetical protein
VTPVPIYRAPIRARDRDCPPGAGAEYGLEHGVVGIGPGEGEKAERMLDRFRELPDGVFVWTRDEGGRYHLGALAGPYRPDDSPAAREVGIRHVRPVEWAGRPFGEDEVPPGVAHTFARGGRNLQRIHDAGAERRTAELWEGGG